MTNTSSVQAHTPPSKGEHNGFCVDVVNLGDQETEFGLKHQIKLVWEIEERKKSGYRFNVGRKCNVSFYDKSTLVGILESWLDRKLNEEEKTLEFVLSLKGKQARLKLGHKPYNGVTIADLKKVLPAVATVNPSNEYRTPKQWEQYHREQEGGAA